MNAKQKTSLLVVVLTAICLVIVSGAQAAQTKMITQSPKMKMTIPIPENITSPDKVETPIGTLEFFDGIPIGHTKEVVYDYMDRARAVQIYVDMMPAVSTYSLLQGSRDLPLYMELSRS
jgi:hypothetical protein